MTFETWRHAYEESPFVYGVSDCCLALADWALVRGHPDLAAGFRGTYSNEAEMYQVISEYTDVVGIIEHCAVLAGIQQAARPEAGSVAVIGSASNMYRQWGAIYDGARWQVRLKQGFVGLIARPLKIWKV